MSETTPTPEDEPEPREEDLPEKPPLEVPPDQDEDNHAPAPEDVPEKTYMRPEDAADDPTVDDTESDLG